MSNIEIERKFLVTDDSFLNNGVTESFTIHQYYFLSSPLQEERIRLIVTPKTEVLYSVLKAFRTTKSSQANINRYEFEESIDIEQALNEIKSAISFISKHRTCVLFNDILWEVDQFHGNNQSLVMVEVELQSIDQHLILPNFVGEEVTGNKQYYNKQLAGPIDNNIKYCCIIEDQNNYELY
jgi:adenylate cyclase